MEVGVESRNSVQSSGSKSPSVEPLTVKVLCLDSTAATEKGEKKLSAATGATVGYLSCLDMNPMRRDQGRCVAGCERVLAR